MSTFIGQLIGFAAIVLLVWRYVVPPVRRLMAARQDDVRQQLKDSREAAKRLTESTTAHSQAVEAAKEEAEQVVAEAKSDSERITEQLHAQAGVEAERIKTQAAQQIELLRTQLIRQLRLELGHESVRQAGELVQSTSPIPSSSRPPSTVSSTNSTPWRRLAAEVRVPRDRRDALGEPAGPARRWSDRFGEVTADLGPDGLSSVADELASVAKLLPHESVVTRYLADPADDPSPKVEPAGDAAGIRQGRRHRAGGAEGRGVGALVGQCRSGRRHRTRRAAGAAGSRRSAKTWPTRSKSNCSGSPASWMRSRGWSSCWATTARRPRAASSCCAMSLRAAADVEPDRRFSCCRRR